MVLKRIVITKLFGIYDYELNLIDKSLSNVTIIDAPNGMGKTTLLKLINAAIIGDLDCLESIPFWQLDLEFDNEIHIYIVKGTNPSLLVATGCNRIPDRHSRENRPPKKGIQTGGK